jgi:hypothetical protein
MTLTDGTVITEIPIQKGQVRQYIIMRIRVSECINHHALIGSNDTDERNQSAGVGGWRHISARTVA